MSISKKLDINHVRSRFHGLSNDWVLMDNAGGSQILKSAVERVVGFYTDCHVQHGGSYALSQESEARLANARVAMQLLMNAASPDEIVFGPSTSVAMGNLANAMRRQFSAGDEIILTIVDHESNVGVWDRLREFGVVIKFWPVNKETMTLELADLEPLMTERTRLVCVHHVSNVLGLVNPIKEISAYVHEMGARICIDGVAYAPHRAIDVRDMDVDFYVFSAYKVYGPHCAVIYGKLNQLMALDSIYHYFYGKDSHPMKLEPGDPNYELTAALPAIPEYLVDLGRRVGGTGSDRELLEAGFVAITEQEDVLVDRLLSFLRSRNDCTIIGLSHNPDSRRVPTVAFRIDGKDADEICHRMDKYNIAIRWGEFHSNRLVDTLGIGDNNGVVRVSLVHYNTVEEVDQMTSAMTEILSTMDAECAA